MQGLGSVGGNWDQDAWCDVPFYGYDINTHSEVVGRSRKYASYEFGVLWTSFGITLLGGWPGSSANAISNSSQVVGEYSDYMNPPYPRAASWKGGGVTFLPSLGNGNLNQLYNYSGANGVNDLGQIVGWSCTTCAWWYDNPPHAVLWSQTGEITDLGTLAGDSFSSAYKINFFGQIIGSSGNAGSPEWPDVISGRPFISSGNGGITDLNALISPDSGWTLNSVRAINDWGQIVGEGTLSGQPHGFLLTPIYKAFVPQPIDADGSSVFNARRGVIPVKFTLTQNQTPICPVMPATIAIIKASGQTLASVDESTYSTNADNGSNFRIEGCQYGYNLAASALGVGTYRVDISINGIMVGHAVFALK
jgi:probable HAF family extracellular repeat protein